MDDKLFIIAIGGTGMRCLEAFVHLCAAGMFDNKTIEILTLDTDQANGNKGRVEDLIDLYNKVKTNDADNVGGEPRANTFFSAKLNLYRFFTDYSTPGRRTLSLLANTNGVSAQQRQDDQDLADLLFDRDTVQGFALDHGYRAQTHLGSMLMYHGIIEAAANAARGGDVKPQEKALKEFVQLLNKHAANSRVFVFGSVFGGTGASSIPVIPIALRDAVGVVSGGANQLNLDKVKFGSTLLTDYFTFNSPTERQRASEKVVADANNFALNSQAALNFYVNDSSVRRSYKRLYHVGWPAALKINYSEGREGDVVTGGREQRNACHVAELMCAAAAWDFFNIEQWDQQPAQYLYRTVETSQGGALTLSGASFAGAAGDVFENKLGALLAFAHLILSRYGGRLEGVEGTSNLLWELAEKRKITDYASITDTQARQIDKYLKEFAYRVTGAGLESGWIYQVAKSVGAGTFIFAPEAFTTDVNALGAVDPGALFRDPDHNWEAKGYLGAKLNRRFDTFMDLFRQYDAEPTQEQAATPKEQFLARMYNAITEAQNFHQ